MREATFRHTLLQDLVNVKLGAFHRHCVAFCWGTWPAASAIVVLLVKEVLPRDMFVDSNNGWAGSNVELAPNSKQC